MLLMFHTLMDAVLAVRGGAKQHHLPKCQALRRAYRMRRLVRSLQTQSRHLRDRLQAERQAFATIQTIHVKTRSALEDSEIRRRELDARCESLETEVVSLRARLVQDLMAQETSTTSASLSCAELVATMSKCKEEDCGSCSSCCSRDSGYCTVADRDADGVDDMNDTDLDESHSEQGLDTTDDEFGDVDDDFYNMTYSDNSDNGNDDDDNENSKTADQLNLSTTPPNTTRSSLAYFTSCLLQALTATVSPHAITLLLDDLVAKHAQLVALHINLPIRALTRALLLYAHNLAVKSCCVDSGGDASVIGRRGGVHANRFALLVRKVFRWYEGSVVDAITRSPDESLEKESRIQVLKEIERCCCEFSRGFSDVSGCVDVVGGHGTICGGEWKEGLGVLVFAVYGAEAVESEDVVKWFHERQRLRQLCVSDDSVSESWGENVETFLSKLVTKLELFCLAGDEEDEADEVQGDIDDDDEVNKDGNLEKVEEEMMFEAEMDKADAALLLQPTTYYFSIKK